MPPGLLLAVLGPAFVLILAATAQRAVEGYQMARQVDLARKEVADLRQQNVSCRSASRATAATCTWRRSPARS